ncbi:unnamed protein product [Amoebophrya sp. A25]|nr:unnamed protein product [Amoebophrya sp. A25]|eukprot:GSA25T00011264001.1
MNKDKLNEFHMATAGSSQNDSASAFAAARAKRADMVNASSLGAAAAVAAVSRLKDGLHAGAVTQSVAPLLANGRAVRWVAGQNEQLTKGGFSDELRDALEQEGGSSSSTAPARSRKMADDDNDEQVNRPRMERDDFHDDGIDMSQLVGAPGAAGGVGGVAASGALRNHLKKYAAEADTSTAGGAGDVTGAMGETADPAAVDPLKASQLFPAPTPLFTDGVDSGKCLTLHQPWASLIVYGFKRAEGRPWNVDGKNKTFNRGRVWIHAAAQEVDTQTVEQVEKMYRELYRAYPKVPPLPSESGIGYPTSCIIGCVDMLSIEDNEAYKKRRKRELGLTTMLARKDHANKKAREQGLMADDTTSKKTDGEGNIFLTNDVGEPVAIIEDEEADEDGYQSAQDEEEQEADRVLESMIEENNSDFIFWLETPRKLTIPCTFTGDHKFWDIPKDTLRTLQKALIPVRWPAQGLPQQFESLYSMRFDLTGGAGARTKKTEDSRAIPNGGDVAEIPMKNEVQKNGENAKIATYKNKVDKSDRKMYDSLAGADNATTSNGTSKKIACKSFVAYTRLADSFIHLHDLLNDDEQQDVVDTIRDLGLRGGGRGFFVEQIDSKSRNPKICRLSLGEFIFNFHKAEWEMGDLDDRVADGDSSASSRIPKALVDFFRRAVKNANFNIQNIADRFVPYEETLSALAAIPEEEDGFSSSKAKSPKGVSSNATSIKGAAAALSTGADFTPQVAWAEFHGGDAKVELRQEEVVATEDVPVVLINIGDSVKITYTLGVPVSEGGRVLAVTVKSGDALVFGNRCRHLYHGVAEVFKDTRPPSLNMAKSKGAGRLAIILK